jgi:hypothetical protein
MADTQYAKTIMEAIQKRTALLVEYSGEVRPIEPHAIGETRSGNVVVRVWQMAGGSLGGSPVPGWRLMRLDRIDKLEPVDSPSRAPRPMYNPDDSAMQKILARV